VAAADVLSMRYLYLRLPVGAWVAGTVNDGVVMVLFKFVSEDAQNTAVVLLNKLNEIDEVALLDTVVLAACIGFIADLLAMRWISKADGDEYDAERALVTIICKLGNMDDARVLLEFVIAETLSDTRKYVRDAAVRALRVLGRNTIGQNALGQHASSIVHLLFTHGTTMATTSARAAVHCRYSAVSNRRRSPSSPILSSNDQEQGLWCAYQRIVHTWTFR
jgi:hypothetical protein